MKRTSTWMIITLDVTFWVLRIIAAYTDAMGIDFMIKTIDFNMEITIIFVALLSFILIVKRKILGTIIYIIGYFGYFGQCLFSNIQQMLNSGAMSNDYITVLFSLIGVALPIFTFLDLLLEKNIEHNQSDKKTDWFFKNKKYDMKKDEREDKNNYRTL